ncbi:MAG: exo-alpha-sialidase [Bacteroidota bacterium]
MRIASKTVRNGTLKIAWPAAVMVIALCLFYPISLSAQWEQVVSLTANPDTALNSYTNARCIAASGDYVHAVWSERTGDFWQTAYTRSTDGGATWQEQVFLSAPGPAYYGQGPSIAVSGADVHVVWHDAREQKQIVCHRGSSDNGETWGAEQPLTSDSVFSHHSAVAVNGGNVYAVWTEEDPMWKCIYFRCSSDGGATWQGKTTIVEGYISATPTIAVSGSSVHIAWYDKRNGYYDVYYRRSTDNGSTWGEERRMTDSPAHSNGMSIDADGEDVHLVWHDREGGSWNVHYMNSRDGGVTWGANQWITNTSWMTYMPTVAVSGQRVHIVWVDTEQEWNIRYTTSSDAGNSWETECVVTTDASEAYSPFVCASGNIVHVTWEDSSRSIKYRRNPTGNIVTKQEELHSLPSGYALSQNYPNPFSERSSVRFTLPRESKILITLHDMLGRRIATLAEGDWGVGEHVLRINGTTLPSGNYICRMQAGAVSLNRMLSLIQR